MVLFPSILRATWLLGEEQDAHAAPRSSQTTESKGAWRGGALQRPLKPTSVSGAFLGLVHLLSEKRALP